jgi:M6 family metalloprotease-like protein
LLLVIAFFAWIPIGLKAVIAYPYPIEFKQPNGETIVFRMHGDEYFHYAATEDGSVIAFNERTGYFMYAVIDDGQLLPGTVKVTSSSLKSTATQRLKRDSKEFVELVKRPALERTLQERSMLTPSDAPQLRSSKAQVTGTRKGLVILANFTDKKFVNTKTAFENMLNQEGYTGNGGTGSARDFYIDNSAGKFTPEFMVYGPVELPHNIKYYGENSASTGNDKNVAQMIVDACSAANTKYSDLNFADFDTNGDGYLDYVFVFYAGYNEAEGYNNNTDLIWPQTSSAAGLNVKIDGKTIGNYACTSELRGNTGSNMAGIGTFTHEFGHVLGLPDLYDADGNVNGEGTGIGYWSTMGSGSYLNSGRTPPYFGAVERFLLGWINPTYIVPSETSSLKTLPPITSGDNNRVYRMNTPVNEEYFLFEVRKKQGWDTYLNGEGMLIYHIDRTTAENKTVTLYGTTQTLSALRLWDYFLTPNIIGNHQCCDLLRANGIPNTESGNPFPGTTGTTTVSDFTQPGFVAWDNSRTYARVFNISRNQTDGSVSFDLKRVEESPYPLIQTLAATNVFQTTAVLNASLVENGPSPVNERGFCWSISANPTTGNSSVKVSGAELGAYSATITGLTQRTVYHVRAYVKTTDGQTYYGNDLWFMTLTAPKELPYTENFDAGIPETWTVKDNNNDGVTWFSAALNNGVTKWGVAAIEGNNNTSNDWLITPQLSIPSNLGNIFLDFDVAITSTQVLEVMVSQNAIDESSFKDEAEIKYGYDGNSSSGIRGWYSLGDDPIDLRDYAGKSVFVAIVNNQSNLTPSDGLYVTNLRLWTEWTLGTEKVSANVPLVFVQQQTVCFNNVDDADEAEIYDTAGRLRDKFPVASGTTRYISEPGVYIVKLNNKKGTPYSYKIFIGY